MCVCVYVCASDLSTRLPFAQNELRGTPANLLGSQVFSSFPRSSAGFAGQVSYILEHLPLIRRPEVEGTGGCLPCFSLNIVWQWKFNSVKVGKSSLIITMLIKNEHIPQLRQSTIIPNIVLDMVTIIPYYQPTDLAATGQCLKAPIGC